MNDLPTGAVTLLFTDIEGSTPLVRDLDDRYGLVLDDYRRLLRTAVSDAGGREVDCRADEFFAAFSVRTTAFRPPSRHSECSQLTPGPMASVCSRAWVCTRASPALLAARTWGLTSTARCGFVRPATVGRSLLSQVTHDLVAGGIETRDLGASVPREPVATAPRAADARGNGLAGAEDAS
jgi:hypothetical protein